MTAQEAQLNSFLVDVFHDILRLEEASIRKGPCKNLSVSEMHVLEAAAKLSDTGGPVPGGSMAQVAALLGVTLGTLSVAVKTLEQKGYLSRVRASRDRRRVTLALTDAALPALESHRAFHAALVRQASAQLSAAQMDTLTRALVGLHQFFSSL